jgi:PPOX class probable F420-dependent enzyme
MIIRQAKSPRPNRDLAQCPPAAALTTVTPGGYPQTSVVWCDFDGQCLRVNTMRGFAKEQNMRRNPRVTLLCYDPCRPLRCLEVRGMVAEMTEAGAAEHLDALASKYAGQPVRFFGGVWVPITVSQPLTWCPRWTGKGGVRDPAGRRRPLRHLQDSCHYDLPTSRPCACSAGWPCSPAPTAPRTPRS